MSYQQGGQQGYGSYNPYGQSGNPYQQETGNSYEQRYSDRPEPVAQGSSYYAQDVEQGGRGYEMSNMNGNDPNRILNECRSLDEAAKQIEADLARLKQLHGQIGSATDVSAKEDNSLVTRIGLEGDEIITKYGELVRRVKKIKSDPESGSPRNAPQVGRVDRQVKTLINDYQQADRNFRKLVQEQMARQYRIVRPEASDAEIREAIEDTGNQQVFSQALINSDRRGNASKVAKQVNDRHKAIQKIESDMMQLAQLFQDLEAAVVQQEDAAMQIEQRGEEVTEHVAKANTELDGAVIKAKAARRKKFMCLGIVVLIIIVIIIVVVVAVEVTKSNK